jgi:hypothetical protein
VFVRIALGDRCDRCRWAGEAPAHATARCRATSEADFRAWHRSPRPRGVLAPVRLEGRLHGVDFRTNLAEDQRASTPWEIADCRLVLALDDFAAILETHDIVEVRHYSMYRVPPKRWADDRIGTRHHGGLALDAARFIRKDGTKLDVLDDFKGRRGSKTCGNNAQAQDRGSASPRAGGASDQQLFNDAHAEPQPRHKNHFHPRSHLG